MYTADTQLIPVFFLQTLTTDHASFDNNKLYHGRMDLNGIFVIAKEQVEKCDN